MKRLSVFVLFLALCSSADAQQVMDQSDRGFDQAELKSIADALVDQTTDPYSAQIIRLHNSTGSDKIICGYVNLRNQYGGYIGFAPFFYSTESKQIDVRQSSGC